MGKKEIKDFRKFAYRQISLIQETLGGGRIGNRNSQQCPSRQRCY